MNIFGSLDRGINIKDCDKELNLFLVFTNAAVTVVCKFHIDVYCYD